MFKRKYIEKKRKNLIATSTGVGLIDTIQNELLKSAEFTGQWERKLRLIEKGEYDLEQFKRELMIMVRELTDEVIFSQAPVRIQLHTDQPVPAAKEKKERKKVEKQSIADGRNVDRNVRPAITVDRVGGDVERGNGVAKHGGVSCKCIPISLGNPVTGLTAPN